MLIKRCWLFICVSWISCALAETPRYTLLDATKYRQTVLDSRDKVKKIIAGLKDYRHQPADIQVGFIVDQLMDVPYQYSFAMGEGDWQPTSNTYQANASHIMQDPVYRLDSFDCQTFVQTLIALLKANNLTEFDRTYLSLAYGAAGNPQGEIVRYYNRNNFVDGDFNKINAANGNLVDITGKGPLAKYAKKTLVEIDRQQFFLHQQEHAEQYVRVLNVKDGMHMVKRFKTVYADLPFPRFNPEHLAMTYLPKEELALFKNGNYVPNQALLANIPTPSVLEIVRDVNQWKKNGKSIKELIGTETSISHVGILYRRRFSFNQLIYYKITCAPGQPQKEVCHVIPIRCKRNYCDELMFANATDLYPHGYVWYERNNNFFCSNLLQSAATSFTYCNRVEHVPLFDYLTNFQYGHYAPMTDSSILGIHLERIR